jgi:hypothetical protein
LLIGQLSLRFSYRFFQESLFRKLGLFHSLHVGGQNTFLPLLKGRFAFKNLTLTAEHEILSVSKESKLIALKSRENCLRLFLENMIYITLAYSPLEGTKIAEQNALIRYHGACRSHNHWWSQLDSVQQLQSIPTHAES